MKVSTKQIEAVFKLPASKRYSHFIKNVVDWELVWGLSDDGWVMSQTCGGEMIFPCWPAKGYAEACAIKEWSECEAHEIDINEFVNELLPRLKEDGVSIGVFYVPDGGSINVEIDTLIADLEEELKKY